MLDLEFGGGENIAEKKIGSDATQLTSEPAEHPPHRPPASVRERSLSEGNPEGEVDHREQQGDEAATRSRQER